jgi:hypothetical protein
MRDTTIRKQGAAGKVITTQAKTGTFSDKWLSLTGVVKPGRAGRPDSLEVKYQIRSEFEPEVFTKRVRKHWWAPGHKQVFVKLRSKNPNMLVGNMDSLPVKKR